MTAPISNAALAPLLRDRGAGDPKNSLHAHLARTLQAVRTHLGMDVAFISEFERGRRVFLSVDSGLDVPPIRVGQSDPLEESYCQRIVDGRLPGLIHDAGKVPEALRLAATALLPVGAHLSVPIVLDDGAVFGTFCCFSLVPDETLTERDLAVMRAIAEVVADSIEADREPRRLRIEAEARIRVALSGNAMETVYQPIIDLGSNAVAGFEGLTRFNLEPRRTPDKWFDEAAQVGLGPPLETRAAEAALRGLAHLPENVYVSINASPETLLNGMLIKAVERWPLGRVVIEVTEHAVTSDYADIARAIAPLRDCGLRLAVDDAGAGYASFRHILSLAPDLIKLDSSLIQSIDTDDSRRSLALALIGFARATGSRIVAEGVERPAQLDTLRELGVNHAQGHLLGRPMSVAALARTSTS